MILELFSISLVKAGFGVRNVTRFGVQPYSFAISTVPSLPLFLSMMMVILIYILLMLRELYNVQNLD